MSNTKNAITGRTFDIHRLSTHDGPGMRTTVFLKGCSLRCTWCHNPESIHGYDELQWLSNKCIGCGKCVQVCEQKALTMSEEGILIDRERCNRCMACVRACPSGAMNRLGETRDVDDVFDIIMQDKLFFENSGGGLTISGGEPLLQGDFVLELLKKAKGEGIHTAIDTSLQVPRETLEKVLPYVDLWLVDQKETDADRQQTYLGTKDTLIQANIEYLTETVGELRSNVTKAVSSGIAPEIWIRTPLIPGMTAREENIRAIGERINELNTGAITLWELCTFNNLCGDKYKKLGLDWVMDSVSLLTKEDKAYFGDLANEVANGTYSLKVSGLTQ